MTPNTPSYGPSLTAVGQGFICTGGIGNFAECSLSLPATTLVGINVFISNGVSGGDTVTTTALNNYSSTSIFCQVTSSTIGHTCSSSGSFAFAAGDIVTVQISNTAGGTVGYEVKVVLLFK